MTTLATNPASGMLSQYEGSILLSAAEAILKGVLESEAVIDLITGPVSGAFAPVVEAMRRDAAAAVLRSHGAATTWTMDATRALELAVQAAHGGRQVLALIPNDQLDRCLPWLTRSSGRGGGFGGLTLIFEDDPARSGASDPRRVIERLNLAGMEPSNLAELREHIEAAARLSRAAGMPMAMVAHRSILASIETLEARPNRIVESVEAMIARRRRRAVRFSESGDVLKQARRLELNPFRRAPNPGETADVGFITVGAADDALSHVIEVVGLEGRVPVLKLGLFNPLDEPAVARILQRCREVVVLEPRPGSVEGQVLVIAEQLRHQGERPANVWGRRLPDDEGGPVAMGVDDALHPSILARKIIHLLHRLRPTLNVAAHLMPSPPPLTVQPGPRGAELGIAAASLEIRAMFEQINRRLARREEVDGAPPPEVRIVTSAAGKAQGDQRLIVAEIWDDQRFMIEGLAAIRHASSDAAMRLLVVCNLDPDQPQDFERMVRGAIPGRDADRVRLISFSMAQQEEAADAIFDAAQEPELRLCVVVLHDSPQPRFSPSGLESTFREVDRLGYQPRQRVVWPADAGASIDQAIAVSPEQQLDSSRNLVTNVEIEHLKRDQARKFSIHVRPLLEQIDVIRSRPPGLLALGTDITKLPVPTPLHGQQSVWRAHLAGLRTPSPGLATNVLCEAGRFMGYQVRAHHEATLIGPGRASWAQVLFTRAGTAATSNQLSAEIPYGEADLLLGLDPQEVLRAIAPTDVLRVASTGFTRAVANRTVLTDDAGHEHAVAAAATVPDALRQVCVADGACIEDFSGICRWAFHSDRMTDLLLLGAGFQRGFIPVSLEAIEHAIARIEATGYGRLTEAFRFGQHLALDPTLFVRHRQLREESIDQLKRRVIRAVGKTGFGGKRRARLFQGLIEDSLSRMPGLMETAAGRRAVAQFLIGISRCRMWGGHDYAADYAATLHRLYEADRAQSGRALTTLAVLPLAEALLPPDPMYLARMALSLEHRRRTMLALNIRRGRGDQIERHFLTRYEVTAFGRRWRADWRTSDWPAAVGSLLGLVVPLRWRGTHPERRLRRQVQNLIEQAISESPRDYEHWRRVLSGANAAARNQRLDLLVLEEIVSSAKVDAPPPQAGDAGATA